MYCWYSICERLRQKQCVGVLDVVMPIHRKFKPYGTNRLCWRIFPTKLHIRYWRNDCQIQDKASLSYLISGLMLDKERMIEIAIEMLLSWLPWLFDAIILVPLLFDWLLCCINRVLIQNLFTVWSFEGGIVESEIWGLWDCGTNNNWQNISFL